MNLIQADETNRKVKRIEVPLFDTKAYKEAIMNSFVHNDWLHLNSPMISVFKNRIEILSRGGIPKGQTINGFFRGESILKK